MALVLGTAVLVLGGAYLAVVPGLSDRLTASRLADLDAATVRYEPQFQATLGTYVEAPEVLDRIRLIADAAGVRVTVLLVSTGSTLSAIPTYDSNTGPISRDLDFAVGQAAARTGRPQQGTEATADGRIVEAARPLFVRRDDGVRVVSYVIVMSAPIGDVDATAAEVRDRLLWAGLAGLLVAVVAAVAGTRSPLRRIQRLERAARRVARGDLAARFPVGREDELGRLARTLDDMRRQLAELESARKRFIATASHELRTPVFSLGGFVELLQDEDLDDETRDRFLTQVREQVERLGKLATDLLDLSRLESGSVELHPEATDLGELVRDVAREFEPALHQHDSNLELRVPQSGLEARCDPERVAQVMRILIDNALVHTPAGTDVVVSAARRGARLRLGVGDFGPGIHRTSLPHIFEPFVTSDDAQGSGLGLAIAHELAERMDGALAVESMPGRTIFTLELPSD